MKIKMYVALVVLASATLFAACNNTPAVEETIDTPAVEEMVEEPVVDTAAVEAVVEEVAAEVAE